jgi:hypothetical protein
MAPKTNLYVPGVRWRTGEYQALLALSDHAKDQVIPLITIPPLEYDFEDGEPKKTVQKHIAPFPKRYKEKWKARKAWIDVDVSLQDEKMASGQTVFSHIFDELRKFSAAAVPVASLDCAVPVLAELSAIVARDKKGIAVRARLEHVMLADFAKKLSDLLANLQISVSETDLIVDLGTPVYEPYGSFANALIGPLSDITNLEQVPP